MPKQKNGNKLLCFYLAVRNFSLHILVIPISMVVYQILAWIPLVGWILILPFTVTGAIILFVFKLIGVDLTLIGAQTTIQIPSGTSFSQLNPAWLGFSGWAVVALVKIGATFFYEAFHPEEFKEVKWQLNSGVKFLELTFCAYMFVAFFVFAPYYNWQFAQQHGFKSWVMLGQTIPTIRGGLWPYFLFKNSNPQTESKKEMPVMSASEMEIVSRIGTKATTHKLTDKDINEYRQCLESYYNRNNLKTSKAEAETFSKMMSFSTMYSYELGLSLLNSWNLKQKSTTNNFDKLLAEARKSGLRKPENIQNDLACIEAAAHNATYVEHADGHRFEFGYNAILEGLKQNELAMNNNKRLEAVMAELATE